ncbi:zinc-dependent alcohol dehydrogenase family protein [Paenibacillus spongiae]|uniref:Zinc-dependent alcohol dehydrogenase family protein n=1 Tax=Paenibacillus spongiae TaxID=2909671 RepID=A0ABY5SFZ6_9BACL|nr:zinc-dependent alcohol dehydrogenase family protein [Paenibacillus spongiae]UVI32866.1 zinc-dependent alcohol dehydrogenase family protein [Paenibacillus spongiae]
MHPRVVTYDRFGEPAEVLQIEHREPAKLLTGQIRVRMNARSINPSDWIPIRGAYPHRTPLPSIPGYEGVGVVEEIGPAVPHALLGQRVLPLRGEGTWQELVAAPAQWAVAVPSSIEDDAACQLYINPLTAWVLCAEVMALQAKDVVIVNAGGSSFGRIFAQLSSNFGFKLIALTRSDVHTKDLLSLGAFSVVNTSDTKVYQAIMELTGGRGASAAVDCIGGDEGVALLRSVRPGGMLVSIGLLSGKPVNLARQALGTGVNIKLFHLRNWLQTVSAEEWQGAFRAIIQLTEREQLRLMNIRGRYPLHDVVKAMHAAVSSSSGGKIVLTS